jgi:hypothetical protein
MEEKGEAKIYCSYRVNDLWTTWHLLGWFSNSFLGSLAEAKQNIDGACEKLSGSN